MKIVWKSSIPVFLFVLVCMLCIFVLCLLYRVPLEFLVLAGIVMILLACLLLYYYFHNMRRALRALESANYNPDEYLPEQQPLARMLEKKEDQIADQSYQHVLEKTDLLDYFSLWAHDAKLPLAAMKLQLDGDELSRSDLKRQLLRIDRSVSNAMAYLRMEADSTDYLIQEIDLNKVVRPLMRLFAPEFIARRIQMDYQIPENARVLSDEKWLSFVIEQLLSNALKYTPAGGTITISFQNDILHIKDTGPGISRTDLPRIFEKGYTGQNGDDKTSASSGMGLYLCRKICMQLRQPLTITSKNGTDAAINLSRRHLEL